MSDADLPALGRAMIDNTDAQRRLHDDLVGSDAQTVIDIARANRALGWKVNGAGGDGGSITLLCAPDSPSKRRLLGTIRDASTEFEIVPIRLSRHGVRVQEM
jgi:D-glycero-alpha-D-manno-heptose-7-phosphate kinase